MSPADEVVIRLYLSKNRRGMRYREAQKSRFVRQAAAELGVDAFSVRWVMNMLELEKAAYEMTAPKQLPAQGDAAPSWAELRAAMDGDRHWRK